MGKVRFEDDGRSAIQGVSVDEAVVRQAVECDAQAGWLLLTYDASVAAAKAQGRRDTVGGARKHDPSMGGLYCGADMSACSGCISKTEAGMRRVAEKEEAEVRRKVARQVASERRIVRQKAAAKVLIRFFQKLVLRSRLRATVGDAVAQKEHKAAVKVQKLFRGARVRARVFAKTGKEVAARSRQIRLCNQETVQRKKITVNEDNERQARYFMLAPQHHVHAYISPPKGYAAKCAGVDAKESARRVFYAKFSQTGTLFMLPRVLMVEDEKASRGDVHATWLDETEGYTRQMSECNHLSDLLNLYETRDRSAVAIHEHSGWDNEAKQLSAAEKKHKAAKVKEERRLIAQTTEPNRRRRIERDEADAFLLISKRHATVFMVMLREVLSKEATTRGYRYERGNGADPAEPLSTGPGHWDRDSAIDHAYAEGSGPELLRSGQGAVEELKIQSTGSGRGRGSEHSSPHEGEVQRDEGVVLPPSLMSPGKGGSNRGAAVVLAMQQQAAAARGAGVQNIPSHCAVRKRGCGAHAVATEEDLKGLMSIRGQQQPLGPSTIAPSGGRSEPTDSAGGGASEEVSPTSFTASASPHHPTPPAAGYAHERFVGGTNRPSTPEIGVSGMRVNMKTEIAPNNGRTSSGSGSGSEGKRETKYGRRHRQAAQSARAHNSRESAESVASRDEDGLLPPIEGASVRDDTSLSPGACATLQGVPSVPPGVCTGVNCRHPSCKRMKQEDRVLLHQARERQEQLIAQRDGKGPLLRQREGFEREPVWRSPFVSGKASTAGGDSHNRFDWGKPASTTVPMPEADPERLPVLTPGCKFLPPCSLLPGVLSGGTQLAADTHQLGADSLGRFNSQATRERGGRDGLGTDQSPRNTNVRLPTSLRPLPKHPIARAMQWEELATPAVSSEALHRAPRRNDLDDAALILVHDELDKRITLYERETKLRKRLGMERTVTMAKLHAKPTFKIVSNMAPPLPALRAGCLVNQA